MKAIAVALLLALTIGCGTKPMELISLTPLPLDAAFTCVFRKVNELGYTVVSVDKAAGYLTAEKQTHAKSLGPLGGNVHRDYLTVSIYDVDGAKHTIRVIVSSDKEERSIAMVRQAPTRVSDQAKADAGAVITACNRGANPQP